MCIGGPGSSGSSATSGFEPRPNIASERERHEIFRGNARYFVQRDEERRQPFYECAHRDERETRERRAHKTKNEKRPPPSSLSVLGVVFVAGFSALRSRLSPHRARE